MPTANSLLPYVESVCVNPEQGRPLAYDRYAYLRQPLTDLSPRIVVQKAAQVGATVMAILRALWFIDVRRAHTLYLFPTHRSAARFSRGRFSVLLERSPYLRGLFREVRSGSHLRAGVVNFYCHGARSRAELMSTPVQCLTLDERDELYLGSPTGRQPWSAVELARQRLSGQREHWELDLSTPTIPGYGIAAEFAQSDQHHYLVLCPRCEHLVHLTWPEAVEWEEDSRQRAVGSRRNKEESGNAGLLTAHCPLPTATAHFRCPRCKQPWSDEERQGAIANGCWKPFREGRVVRGYHLSQLLSPAASAERLVAQWLASESHPPARQVFYNSVLGLPYLAEGARLERRFLEEAIARGGYAMTHTSQGSIMGVDVGPTWFHVVIGEPVNAGLRLIWVGKVYDWPQLAELVRRYRVQSFVIDAMPETHRAREFVRAFPQGYLCYYRAGEGVLGVDPAAHTLKAPRTESLDAMFLRWRTGMIAAPQDLPAEFVEQMTALVRVVRLGRDGQAYAEFLEAGSPDHYAHAMNYCELALALRGKPLRFEITEPGSAGNFLL